jgi:tRNA pseudouridine55 synthase
MNGLLILNKPSGITSRSAVDRAETWFPGVKIGHAGTLDPLATGVLVVCLGAGVRLIEYVQDLDKTYAATIRLGAWSDTDDADGTVSPNENPPIPEPATLEEVLTSFTGEIEQTPPDYSAARIDGRRAHHFARRGREVRLTPRRVRIDRIELVSYVFPELRLIIECGKGTYIRSLARDLGERLGCGALVSSLERTRIGSFHLSDAVNLDADAAAVRPRVLPLLAAVPHLPRVTLPDADLTRLRQGQTIAVPALPTEQASGDANKGTTASAEMEVALLDGHGELIAIAVCQSGAKLKARKVFKRWL